MERRHGRRRRPGSARRRRRGALRRGDGRRAARRARARSRSLGRALEPRLRRARDGHTVVRVDLRGAGRSRELERDRAHARALGGRLAAVLERLELERPTVVGHSLGAAVALKLALERPELPGALVLIGGEADLSNLAPRMLASAERIESMGLAAWVTSSGRRTRRSRSPRSHRDAGDPRRVPRPAARERRRGLRPPVPRDRRRRAALRSPRRGRPAGARPRRRARRPHAARARPRARAARCRTRGSSSCRTSATRSRSRRRRRRRTRSRAFLARASTADGARDGRAGVLRADTTPRNSREGPFGHLDVRWVVGRTRARR